MPENYINSDILEGIIYGRVEPHIYAFSTETIPNYMKVGDTYRPIEKRLNEWRKYYPNLERKYSDVAKADDQTFYRDLSVHYFLESEKKRKRLQTDSIPDIPYYSKEFFENTSIEDIQEAVNDIRSGFTDNNGKYQFYKFDSSRIPVAFVYDRVLCFLPRPNQDKTIKKFKIAVDNGRTNLLMYAVMRFGKSFTSLCCATEIDARIVVVVSAKADVKSEWKKTTESHKRFKDYEFLDSDSLLASDTVISDNLAENKKLVIFLTLQDLQGDDIKAKHQELFDNEIDLLIVDETHFGARASEYGKVLQSKTDINRELKGGDETLEELENSLKVFIAKIRLHLSGTPYRILMGSEFTDEDIIAFYQFTDIADDQQKWDEENLNKDDVKEWDNPYYGFPQMIRFAFNPNESSRKKMEDLKNNGITYAFSALFRPKSIRKDTVQNLHKKFEHESEILDLLEVIDGSKNDENLLGFLDYDKIKKGNMCRHIVCVLPFRASCDALENLIIENKERFKNLCGYEIINIAGVENETEFRNTQDVKTKIKAYEAENKKTITLTVNRMLTGSTVEEWDTMLYFKDTASPQEYDQAIFRLQNQYIREFVDENNDVIKFNMKPQTLLVDFDPNRMFVMQEQKSQIYNVNTDANGNSKLEKRLSRELEISPIITLNHNKLVEVKAADVLDAVRKYSSERSVLDEATTLPVDLSILDNPLLKEEIEKQGEIGSKQGLEIKAVETDGEGDDFDIDESNKGEDNINEQEPSYGSSEETKNDEISIKKKFATYYSKILFFAFLTNSKVKSLQEILDEINENLNNQRLAKNLGLKIEILNIFQAALNPFILSELDYKIQNINTLTNDLALRPIERAEIAMRKFTRLSESEIVTPENVTERMIDVFPEGAITEKTKLLDIASKQGEFAFACYKKFGKNVAKNFYSIPTSKIAYEFTRKVYELLELDVSHIESKFTSYDLIKDENEIIQESQIKINNDDMKFDVVIGNPPYQAKDGGAGASAKPIYNFFVEKSQELEPQYISMIIPTRWFSGGKGLDDFREKMLNDPHISELHDFLNPKVLFQDTNNRGGICFFLWNKEFNAQEEFPTIYTYKEENNPIIDHRNLKNGDSEIFIRHSAAIDIIKKIKEDESFESIEGYVSARKPFNIDGNIIKDKEKFFETKVNARFLKCYGRGMKIGYVNESLVTKNKDWIKKFKVFAPYANNIGTELNDDNLNSFIGKPKEICTETYIVIGADLNLDSKSANNLSKFLTTKFARFLQSLAKISQHGTAKTYQYIPIQNFNLDSDIDWSKSVNEVDQRLYSKYNLTEEEIEYIEESIKPM